MSFVTRFMNDESGATAIEYGLIAAGVGIAILSGIASLGNGLNTLFGEVAVAL
ncbi:MAG: Flp family type IVb pilin [Alphaproteobacteria bacterium]|jgi:pilus assembly protein Flp/PilA